MTIPQHLMDEASRLFERLDKHPNTRAVLAEALLAAEQRGEQRERQAAERYKATLEALDAATRSAIRENDNPNRVIFKDGFVLEGRGADEWLRFMRLIQTCVAAALRKP